MIGLGNTFPRTLLFVSTLWLSIFGLEITAHADTPNTTRAARLTFAQGTVTVNAPGTPESAPAQMNLPLLSGVQIATGADGQAEVEFEDGSVVRLTPNSALSLDNLSVLPNGGFVTSVRLIHGLAYFELRAAPQFQYVIVAGSDVLTPVENTTVRVNFDEPPAIFAVLDGTAHVDRQIPANVDAANAGFQTDVRAGESLRGDASDATRYLLTPGITEDTWDQWNEDMDQSEAAQASDSTSVRNNYEGAQGYGWSDLDANGTWYDVPGQGPVWQPQIAADDMSFDPYGDGEWFDYPGAGYLWASAYPWGWTPYRCGTWGFYGGFGWGWAPGAGCGGFGWGFYGGGQVVNIGAVPVGYRPVRVPVTGPHPVHPILPVHTYQPGAPSHPVQYGQRQIAGKTASAIAPVSNSFASGSAGGASLRRDFPMDAKSHAPVLGLASTTPSAVHTTRGSSAPQSMGQRPVTGYPGTAVGPATGTPVYNGEPRQQPARPQTSSPPPARPQTYSPPQRPTQQTAPPTPVQRPAQQQAAPPRYTPPPQVSRPSYSPPPSPPPAPHPTYSPPPAPPAAPRSSPK